MTTQVTIEEQRTMDTYSNTDTNSKNTKTERQHIHAILDRSGSMTGKTENVLMGLRTQVNDLQKEEDCSIFLSVKMFDTSQSILLNTTNVKDVTESHFEYISEQYKPRSQTAIKDALGDSINYLIGVQLSSEKYDDVIVYLFTDGLENASTNINYTGDKLKKIIENSEKEHNIKVLYVGSNQDSIFNACNLGISAGRAMDYNESTEGVCATYRALSQASQRSRSHESVDFTLPERTRSMC